MIESPSVVLLVQTGMWCAVPVPPTCAANLAGTASTVSNATARIGASIVGFMLSSLLPAAGANLTCAGRAVRDMSSPGSARQDCGVLAETTKPISVVAFRSRDTKASGGDQMDAA